MADDMLIKNFGGEYMRRRNAAAAERHGALSKMSNRELALEVKKGRITLSEAMRFRAPAPLPANLEESLMQSDFAAYIGACRRVLDKHPIISHLAPIGRTWIHGLTVPQEAAGYLLQSNDGLYIAAPEIFAGWSCKKCETLLAATFRKYDADKVISGIRRAMLFAEDLTFTRGFMTLREADVIASLLADTNTSKALYHNVKAWDIFCGWANKVGVHVETNDTPQTPEAPTATAPEGPTQDNDADGDGGDMYVPAGPSQ